MAKVWDGKRYYVRMWSSAFHRWFRIYFFANQSVEDPFPQSWDHVELCEGAIASVKMEKTRDGWFGVETKDVAIEFNLAQPIDGNFLGMIAALGRDVSVSIDLAWTWRPRPLLLTMRLRNICVIYDESTSQTIFVGVQKNSFGSDYNPETKVLTTVWTSLARAVLENIDMALFVELWRHEPTVRQLEIEYYGQKQTRYGQLHIARLLVPKGDSVGIYYVRWSDFEWAFGQILMHVLRYFLRQTSGISANIADLTGLRWTFFRQKYDFSGRRGTALSESDIWVAGVYTVEKKGKKYGGFLGGSGQTIGAEDEPSSIDGGFFPQLAASYRTAWDWQQDWATTRLVRIDTSTTGTITGTTFSYTVSYTQHSFESIGSYSFATSDVANSVAVQEYGYGAEAVARVDASYVETVAEDIDHLEVVTNSSRSEKTLDMAVAISTTLTQAETTSKDIQWLRLITSQYFRGLAFWYHEYFTMPIEDGFVRVHELPEATFSITGTPTSATDIAGVTDGELDVSQSITDVAKPGFVDRMQKRYSIGYLIAAVAKAVLATDYVTSVKIETTTFPPAEALDSFNFDGSSLHAVFANAPKGFVVQHASVELFANKPIEIEGVSIGI